MDLETTNDQSDLDVIASLSEPATEPTGSGEPATSAETTTTPQAVEPEQPQVDPREQELERLKRVIAGDQHLRQKYEAELYREYGEPYTPSQPVQQTQQPEPIQQPQAEQQTQAPQLPFTADDYDPMNIEHQVGLIGTILQHSLGTALKPFQEFIDSQKAFEEQQAKQQAEAETYQKAAGVETALAESIPGFKEISALQNHTEDQAAFLQFAANKYLSAVQAKYPQGLWFNNRVSKEIAAQIAPDLKRFGNALGIFQPANANQQVKQRETFIEGSNAVPAESGNAFEKAFAKDDTYGMLSALKL